MAKIQQSFSHPPASSNMQVFQYSEERHNDRDNTKSYFKAINFDLLEPKHIQQAQIFIIQSNKERLIIDIALEFTHGSSDFRYSDEFMHEYTTSADFSNSDTIERAKKDISNLGDNGSAMYELWEMAENETSINIQDCRFSVLKLKRKLHNKPNLATKIHKQNCVIGLYTHNDGYRAVIRLGGVLLRIGHDTRIESLGKYENVGGLVELHQTAEIRSYSEILETFRQ